MKAIVNINNIDKVKKLASEACKCDFDIDVISGRYTVDAKSIMGLFSINLSNDIELNIHATEEDASNFLSNISELLINK